MTTVDTVPIEPLAYPIPEAARRSGHGETRFREAIAAGEIAWVPNGDRRLILDEEILRWLRSKQQRTGSTWIPEQPGFAEPSAETFDRIEQLIRIVHDHPREEREPENRDEREVRRLKPSAKCA
jgi:hypothetical protein